MIYKCITSKYYRKRNGFVVDIIFKHTVQIVDIIFKHTVQSQHFHIDTCPEYGDQNK